MVGRDYFNASYKQCETAVCSRNSTKHRRHYGCRRRINLNKEWLDYISQWKSLKETRELQNDILTSYEFLEELNQNLTIQLAASREYLNTLRSKFARIDLTMEALQDPDNLEARVDRAVERLIQDIADETTPPSDTADDSDGVPGQDE